MTGKEDTDAPSSSISVMNSHPSERQLQMSITFHQISTNNQTKRFFQFVHINYPHMSQLPVIVILPKETPPYCPRSNSSSFQLDNILQRLHVIHVPKFEKNFRVIFKKIWIQFSKVTSTKDRKSSIIIMDSSSIAGSWHNKKYLQTES